MVGIEPTSGVLETLILPLNYTPKWWVRLDLNQQCHRQLSYSQPGLPIFLLTQYMGEFILDASRQSIAIESFFSFSCYLFLRGALPADSTLKSYLVSHDKCLEMGTLTNHLVAANGIEPFTEYQKVISCFWLVLTWTAIWWSVGGSNP